MIIKNESQVLSIKFGTLSLILLEDFLNIDSDEKSHAMFVSSIINNADGSFLSQEEKEKIYKNNSILRNSLKELLQTAVKESLGDYKEFSKEEFKELYSIAIGEIGISPSEFYMMSPHEVDLAYKGYINRKEFECNNMLIALRKNKDSNANLVSYLGGEGYNRSTLVERKNTFDALGI